MIEVSFQITNGQSNRHIHRESYPQPPLIGDGVVIAGQFFRITQRLWKSPRHLIVTVVEAR